MTTTSHTKDNILKHITYFVLILTCRQKYQILWNKIQIGHLLPPHFDWYRLCIPWDSNEEN